MLHWIITISIGILLTGLGFFAHRKTETVRKDERPHQVPWGLIMIGCVFGVFLVIVHMLNIFGLETGPEHSPFGRF
ncbi:MAG: hypothetical protein Hens3KO_17090 [Henriciella sp.]